MHPPVLLRRYLSWQPATLTGNIHLRSFGTATGSRESELGIDEIGRMLETFTQYWGFYFVAAQDTNRVGIPDLSVALDEMVEDPQWKSDLRFVSADTLAHQNDLNSRIAGKQLQEILAARTVVFKLFLQLAIKVDGELLERHKRIWLLFQSQVGPVQTPHPVHMIVDKCLLNASPKALRILVRRIYDIRREYFPGSNFLICLDEAQQAARLYPHAFISSINPNKYRNSPSFQQFGE